MNEFLYIYRGGSRLHSPEEMQQQTQKWYAWIKGLGEQGHIKNPGQPLDPSGKVVANKTVVTDGPYAETKDIVNGYTLVLAKDIDEAVELAAGCPIFNTGGLVEVRPVIAIAM